MPVVALFLLSLLWGSTFFFTKVLLPDLHPVSIVFFRCFFGGLTLLPIFLWKKKKKDFEHLPALFGITLLSAGIPWVFMSFSQQGLETTVSAVLNATGPIFGLIYSIFILKANISGKQILSVSIGFTGILIAFLMGFSTDMGFRLDSAGLLLLAVSLYALSAILTSRFLGHVSVFVLSFTSMMVGAVYSGLIMVWVEPFSFEALNNIDNITAIIMLGVFNSGIGNILYFYLVKSGGPVFALLITYLMPITTIILGVIALNERFGPGTFIALIFVLTSVYFTQRKGGKRDATISASGD